jgi:DNA modification methylase
MAGRHRVGWLVPDKAPPMKPYYQDDSVTIYHGDALEILPVTTCDVVLTDPPYGIGAHRMTLGNGRRRIDRGDRDWDAVSPDLEPLLALGVPAIIWGGNYHGLPASRCWLVWDKGTGDNDYADCELAWTNINGVVKRYYRLWVGTHARERTEMRLHPTQKPVELMRWCLGFLPAGVVLDPYMGSGTTLVAAKDLGRRAIGIEIEERYCEIAARRCSQEVLGLSA